MSTRTITSDDAAAAAEVVRLVRERPNDRIDPSPPAHEMEILADAGARVGERHPLVAVEEAGGKEVVVGYGAVDASDQMKRAVLVGPVVHPAHRRRGHGSRLLAAMLDQARRLHQRFAVATIASANGAAKAALEASGFRKKDEYRCLRLPKPDRLPGLTLDGVGIRRVDHDDVAEVYEFTNKLVPRAERQVRSLLKSDEYVIILATRGRKVVGFAELDMRYGDIARVEQIDAIPSLITKGLGNILLSNLLPYAYDAGRTHVEIVVSGPNEDQIDAYAAAGFEPAESLFAYERKL